MEAEYWITMKAPSAKFGHLFWSGAGWTEWISDAKSYPSKDRAKMQTYLLQHETYADVVAADEWIDREPID